MLRVPAARVAKSVALLVGAQPWLAVMRGDSRLDLRKVRAGKIQARAGEEL